MTVVVVPAPAKINLALHVVGRREDGYHLLDMLVAFTPFGDIVTAARDDSLSLAVEGPFAVDIAADEDNLVMRAARLLAAEIHARGGHAAGARLTLTKELPIASGIGGGSADAAATLIALNQLWNAEVSIDELRELGKMLGADVPMCLVGKTARVGGIGERVEPLAPLPAHGLVLVNPRRAVATPTVFRRLASRDNPPLPTIPPQFHDFDALARWLGTTRNDLQATAISIEPTIDIVLGVLAQETDCRVSRMSGSGATCFGLFGTKETAARAAARLASSHPDWWIRASS